MKAVLPAPLALTPAPLVAEATVAPSKARPAADRSTLAALATLTKPRIVVLVLVTVAVGFVLGDRGEGRPLVLACALLGTGLVAAGASVWNQVLERDRDALMRRTAGRPLPAGQVGVVAAAAFGTVLALGGIAALVAGTTPLAAGVAALTFVLYAFVYTPLKPLTTLNTAVGAIPGALPPVIGWAAAAGALGAEAASLFLIVFLWQFPHFLAIAWIHRDDYARGGHRMLPRYDPTGAITGRQATLYALALVPVALLPTLDGLAGPAYFVGALGFSLYYLVAASRFWANVGESSARRLLGASFLHLPATLILLVIDRIPG